MPPFPTELEAEDPRLVEINLGGHSLRGSPLKWINESNKKHSGFLLLVSLWLHLKPKKTTCHKIALEVAIGPSWVEPV